jgi:peroxiredoxin
VIITGVSEDYSGETIKLMKYSDLITFTEEELSSAIVDETGKFEFNFTLKETTSVFIYLGIFKGFIVIEPEKSYEIKIPERNVKSVQDYLNPYFKEQEFYFTILNDSNVELNANLLKFDSLYNRALLEIFKNSYSKYKKSKVDSLLELIDGNFKDYENEYFNNYRDYRYATIRKSAYLRDKELAIEKYFVDSEIQYNNPAYMSFFNEIFDEVFSSSTYLVDWDNVRLSIAKESLYGINQSLAVNDMFKDKDFRHLVIIKGLYDLFYSDSADKESVLAVLDSLQAIASKDNKIIINNFWEQATSLLVNYKAPFFELPDKNGTLININDFEGNFIYLSFYHPDSYVCKRQVDLLKILNDYDVDKLEIVTVFIADSPEEMTEFIKDNDCNWTFLYYDNNAEILKDYQILVYPTYVLINPEGKLVKYPASSPEEEFERDFNSFYLEWQKEIERQKKEKKLLGN